MALNVAPGKLDSLIGVVFPLTDYTGISVKSFTTSSNNLATETLTSITVTDTGFPGPGTATGETVEVIGVNDTQNTVTLGILSGGTSAAQLTAFVIGYSSNSILVSLDSSNVDAATLSMNSPIEDITGLISGAPVPLATPITFLPTGSASIAAPTLPGPTPTPTPAPTPAPTPSLSTPGFNVVDTTTGQTVSAMAQPYTGPVAGLTQQFIDITADSLNITLTTPNVFIHSGAGTDAINVSQAGGNNVLDGSTGSNFLTGGSGNDTFFLDDRSPSADVFSTVVGFHSGDNATVFGVNPTDFTMKTLDNQGAAGFTGLDFAFSAPGHPNANFVLTGFTSADLSNGRLTVTFGTTADLPGVPGSQFLNIHAN